MRWTGELRLQEAGAGCSSRLQPGGARGDRRGACWSCRKRNGGVSATEPDNSLSFSDGADPTITGTEELEFGNNLRNSYGVTQNDYKRDRVYDFVPNVPGMVVKVDTLDDGTRTMMVVSENHGFYADRALNLETGSVQFLRLRDNEPEVQIVDYPNTPEAMNAIEHSQVVRDSHFVSVRKNEIEEVL